MSLQIGMLGQDGVILAGDSRINAKPIPGADAPWMSYEACRAAAVWAAFQRN